jgi:repressor LexA
VSISISPIQGSGLTAIGKRLLEAFADKGITSKKAIGEALGFKSDKAIYKVVNGEQELSFDALLRFRESTGRSIDWLLADARHLEEGEFAMYLGEEEHRIIQKLAGKSKRTFEDEVREQLIEHLEEKNLLTTQAGESNVVFFGDYVPNMVSLPFLGEIAAGEPIMIFERAEMIDVPDFRRERNKQYMVLRARGDSMIEELIHDGSLIMCEVTNTAEKGDTIVAMIDNESATVKRYYPERGRIRLQPANPAHLPQFVTDDRLKIQGIVVGIFHKPS